MARRVAPPPRPPLRSADPPRRGGGRCRHRARHSRFKFQTATRNRSRATFARGKLSFAPSSNEGRWSAARRNMVGRLAGHHGLFGGTARIEDERYISRASALAAVADILERIRKVAKEGSLLDLPRAIRLVWIWRQFSTSEEVKAWLSKEIESDRSVLRLAQILPNVSYRSSGKGQEEIRSFKAETYKEVLDTEHFKKRLAAIVEADSTNDAAIEAQRTFLAAEAIGFKER